MSRLAPIARRVCDLTAGGSIGKRWIEHDPWMHAVTLCELCTCAASVRDFGGMRESNGAKAFAYGVPAVHPRRFDVIKLRQASPALRRLLLRLSPKTLRRLSGLFVKQAAFIKLQSK